MGMEALLSAVIGVKITSILLSMLREVPIPVSPLHEQREVVLEYQTRFDEIRILKMRVRDDINGARSLFGGGWKGAPYSAKGKGDDSSIITHIEGNREIYPELRRLYVGSENKVTKTSLKNALTGLMDNELVAAASLQE